MFITVPLLRAWAMLKKVASFTIPMKNIYNLYFFSTFDWLKFEISVLHMEYDAELCMMIGGAMSISPDWVQPFGGV